MRILISLNGPILDAAACRSIARQCDYLVCADGGARHLVAMGLTPDLLVGDLDSIDAASLRWMREKGVRIDRYPVEKDWTDSELAFEAALAVPRTGTAEIWMIGAIGDRVDHMLANLGLASRHTGGGVRVWLTDGRAYMVYLKGPETLRVDLDERGLDDPVVSVVPSPGCLLSGVTLEGFAYPLVDEQLDVGSTRGVSNRVLPGVRQVEVRIRGGEGFVMFSPDDNPGDAKQ